VPNATLDSGFKLHFEEHGTGPPVVLLHGLSESLEAWAAQVPALATRYRVITPDIRGHGRSDKPPGPYSVDEFAEDVRGLLDHLGIERADVMGYSMGARIAACLALADPPRVRSLILGGLGIHLVRGVGLPLGIADAMEAPSLDQLTDPTQRLFRAFAEQTKSDLAALAACIRGSRQTLTEEEVGSIAAPTLIAVGTADTVAGSAQELAALMPRARALDIPGRDHNLAVGDKIHRQGVLAFLAERP
jgi:pimeloyl-ACP methyl ester carboxylesterase